MRNVDVLGMNHESLLISTPSPPYHTHQFTLLSVCKLLGFLFASFLGSEGDTDPKCSEGPGRWMNPMSGLFSRVPSLSIGGNHELIPAIAAVCDWEPPALSGAYLGLATNSIFFFYYKNFKLIRDVNIKMKLYKNF